MELLPIMALKSNIWIKRFIIIIIIIIIYSIESFSYQLYLMFSRWSLSGSKSPQVYRTLRRILADLSNTVVLMLHLSAYS